MRILKHDEERLGQYCSKAKAIREASRLTKTTGRRHQVFLSTTYRNLEPVACWTVCLAMVWRGGNLVLA